MLKFTNRVLYFVKETYSSIYWSDRSLLKWKYADDQCIAMFRAIHINNYLAKI
jgi:hypothetical protein